MFVSFVMQIFSSSRTSSTVSCNRIFIRAAYPSIRHFSILAWHAISFSTFSSIIVTIVQVNALGSISHNSAKCVCDWAIAIIWFTLHVFVWSDSSVREEWQGHSHRIWIHLLRFLICCCCCCSTISLGITQINKKHSKVPDKVSFVKMLTAKKKLKVTASSTYSMDNPVFVDCQPSSSSTSAPVTPPQANHVR